MSTHTSMRWLPAWLRYLGVNVIELKGWQQAQGQYFWTDLATGQRSYHHAPMSYMVHHTAGAIARPEVRDSWGRWSKANVWIGMWDGKSLSKPVLRQNDPGGTPTVVFVAGGPARVSSGFGHGPTLELVNKNVRVNWDQQHSDTNKAANRYAFNAEVVAKGDGSPIDPGVEEAVIALGTALCVRWGWVPWRTIGHLTWTKRKVDPHWNGDKDRIVYIQDKIEEAVAMTYRGVFNVPDQDWARDVVDWGIEEGLIVTGDDFPDDWLDDEITMGRIWTLFFRMRDDE